VRKEGMNNPPKKKKKLKSGNITSFFQPKAAANAVEDGQEIDGDVEADNVAQAEAVSEEDVGGHGSNPPAAAGDAHGCAAAPTAGPSAPQKKPKRRFWQPRWDMYLETEDNPMPDGWAECKKNSIFCKLCKKWGKNNDCAVKGLTRFRDDTFAKHVQSRDHQEAIKLHEGKVSDHRLQVHCSRSDPVTCLRGIAISNAARLLCISFMLDLSRKLLRSEMLLVC
jgi:hypothetical protein